PDVETAGEGFGLRGASRQSGQQSRLDGDGALPGRLRGAGGAGLSAGSLLRADHRRGVLALPARDPPRRRSAVVGAPDAGARDADRPRRRLAEGGARRVVRPAAVLALHEVTPTWEAAHEAEGPSTRGIGRGG